MKLNCKFNYIKKVFLVLIVSIALNSCSKSSSTNSSTSNYTVKYEVIATGSMIAGNSSVTYTKDQLNAAMENTLAGVSWNKTVTLPKGTLVQFETTLQITGTNQSAVANLYIDGVKKTSANSVGNNVLGNTICGTTLQWIVGN
jgi:hypothetical protein